MAPKKAPPKKEPSGVSVQGYCDVIKSVHVVNELTGKMVTKGEAAIALWSSALGGESQREDIFKTGCAPLFIGILDRGDMDDRYAAMGAIQALARSEKHIAEIMSSKVISWAATMLIGEHERAKVPAAQLLSLLSLRAEYSNRVSDLALPAMLQFLLTSSEEDSGWAQFRMTQHHVLLATKALIENTQGDNPESKHVRRMTLIQLGIIPVLVKLVSYMPRMPLPRVIPAPPPVASKKKPSSAKKGKAVPPTPQGRKDAIATAASACLRFLALCPDFVEGLIGSGSLQPFVSALLTANEEQAAYICGILWEVCAEESVAQSVEACGAVTALLHVCSSFLGAAAAGKKSKKKTKAGGKDDKKKPSSSTNEPPPPPCYPDIAVCNATGALHHLTFLDEAKLQVGRVGGVPILTACLKLAKVQTFENATGALWNVGLDINNTRAMKSAGAPGYLSQPVPDEWLMDGRLELGLGNSDDEGGEESGGPVDPGDTFLTQQLQSPGKAGMQR